MKKFQETKISQSFGILVLILLLYIIWYLYKYWILTVVLSYNKNIRALKSVVLCQMLIEHTKTQLQCNSPPTTKPSPAKNQSHPPPSQRKSEREERPEPTTRLEPIEFANPPPKINPTTIDQNHPKKKKKPQNQQ